MVQKTIALLLYIGMLTVVHECVPYIEKYNITAKASGSMTLANLQKKFSGKKY